MENIDFIPNGTITSPLGFTAGAAAADIRNKKDNRLDLGIVCSQEVCTVAGLFTENKIKSPSVVLCQQRVMKEKAKAIAASSGCANASTGEQGFANAIEMTAWLPE